PASRAVRATEDTALRLVSATQRYSPAAQRSTAARSGAGSAEGSIAMHSTSSGTAPRARSRSASSRRAAVTGTTTRRPSNAPPWRLMSGPRPRHQGGGAAREQRVAGRAPHVPGALERAALVLVEHERAVGAHDAHVQPQLA